MSNNLTNTFEFKVFLSMISITIALKYSEFTTSVVLDSSSTVTLSPCLKFSKLILKDEILIIYFSEESTLNSFKYYLNSGCK